MIAIFDNLPVADGLPMQKVLSIDHYLHEQDVETELFSSPAGKYGTTLQVRVAMGLALHIFLDVGRVEPHFPDCKVASLFQI